MATDFQKRVWKEIDKIPYGKTVTYKEIAEKIDKPNASRAVANACARNPSPVIRPCHRVIRTDGSIGGYSASGGAKMKMKLLKKERANS